MSLFTVPVYPTIPLFSNPHFLPPYNFSVFKILSLTFSHISSTPPYSTFYELLSLTLFISYWSPHSFTCISKAHLPRCSFPYLSCNFPQDTCQVLHTTWLPGDPWLKPLSLLSNKPSVHHPFVHPPVHYQCYLGKMCLNSIISTPSHISKNQLMPNKTHILSTCPAYSLHSIFTRKKKSTKTLPLTF